MNHLLALDVFPKVGMQGVEILNENDERAYIRLEQHNQLVRTGVQTYKRGCRARRCRVCCQSYDQPRVSSSARALRGVLWYGMVWYGTTHSIGVN